MWNLVLVRLEVVLVSEQDRSTVCAKHTIGLETFWTHPMVLLCDGAHPMELLGDVAHVESCFSLFGGSVSVGV